VSCGLILQRKVRSVRPNSKRAFWTQTFGGAAVAAGCLLTARTASAEVTIVKTENNWEVYLAGRVGAFFSYAFGEAYPLAPTTGALISGGGVDEKGADTIPKTDNTGMVDPAQRGTLSKMRIRSGMIPNVLTIGTRKKFGEDTTFKVQASIWAQIEPDYFDDPANQKLPRTSGPDFGVSADFREGYLQIESSWGGVQAGRFLSLFSRGSYESDLTYGHAYGVGFPGIKTPPAAGGSQIAGGLTRQGPTSGMAGFGVLGGTYAGGVAYTTPSLSGLKIAAGLFEPVQLIGSAYDGTRNPRPEGEISYDLSVTGFKMHLYGDGAFQKVYNNKDTKNASMFGVAAGGRFEVGPVRVGLGGFRGKGLGLYYPFDASATSVSQAPGPPVTDAMGVTMPGPTKNELRTFQGYSALVQVALGEIDINVGAGQTVVARTDDDKVNIDSLIKSQTGISAGVVYHATENLHLDLDFMNAAFSWYGGQSQKVNFINTGAILTF
jgi:Gram-negative porin